MKKLAILGASGHGQVVAEAAEDSNWEISFFDDGKAIGKLNHTWLNHGGFDELLTRLNDFDGIIVAIGDNKVRVRKARLIQNRGGKLVSIIHPSAHVSRYADIGPGSVVLPCAVINTNVSIGVGCIINSGAIVEHDCKIGDGAHVSPGAALAGGVRLGVESWVGIGASVRQEISIGNYCTVAAGAVVVKEVKDLETVAGVPAVKLR